MACQNCQGSSGTHPSAQAYSRLERPRYAPGLILEDSDLTAAVDYGRELNRLLFRSLFGCGVVCGLEVEVAEDCGLMVTVKPGVAIDACGDVIHVVEPLKLKAAGQGQSPCPGKGDANKVEFWVVLRRGERPCMPRATVCDADDFDNVRVHTRIRETAEVSIACEWPCGCGCKAPDKADKQDKKDNKEPGAWVASKDFELRGGRSDTQGSTCHEQHNLAGCTPGCDCSCNASVVLAGVFKANDAWQIVHKGVRRFVRPVLMADPLPYVKPA